MPVSADRILFLRDQQNGNTVLMLATWEGHLDVVNLLIQAGANKATKNKV
jgi:ankyrin repeat protein